MPAKCKNAIPCYSLSVGMHSLLHPKSTLCPQISAATGDHHRKPPCSELSPDGCVYVSQLLQYIGTLWKQGLKDCKSQSTRKYAVKQSFLEMGAQIRLEEKTFHGVPLLDKTTGNQWLLGGELASPRHKPSYWLFNTSWSALKPFTH